ncbi:MAG: PAS domain S-box-containing protein [Phenylobacterium sp.]|jgi:PAS domain S-box-containing protein
MSILAIMQLNSAFFGLGITKCFQEKFVNREKKWDLAPKSKLAIIVALVFLLDLVVTLITHSIEASPVIQSLLDSTLLMMLISPLIYLFLYRPFPIMLGQHKQTEETHKLAIDDIQIQVEQRTTELNTYKARFSLVTHVTSDGFLDWNLETNEVYYSPSWKNILGYQEGELGTKFDSWITMVRKDEKDWVNEKIQDCIKGSIDSFEAQIRMNHKDGHEVVVLFRGFTTPHDTNGKQVRFIATCMDITEQKISEQFILTTSDILRMIATRKPAPHIYDAIARLYESRHPGMRCSMLILVDTKLMHGGAPSLPKEYCDAVNGLEYGPNVGSCGTSTYTGERTIVEDIATDPKWKDIKHVALPHGMRSCWSEPIKNSSGEVLGAFGMYYDHPALPNEKESNDLESAARLAGIIMEREKSEVELNQYRQNLEELVAERTKELERTKQEAEEANKSKSKFLSSMSHELRTPMNAILGFSQLLEFNPKEPLTKAQKNCVAQILKGGQHLLELINDVLDLAKIESGKMQQSIEDVRVCDAMDECLSLLTPMADNRDINIIIPDPKTNMLTVRADVRRLKQVLLNLTSNAIKYNCTGGTVTVDYQTLSENIARITIKDTGCGIRQNSQVDLFQAFNRLEAANSEIEGTGIGLVVSKGLIEQMQGCIGFESEEGKGSSFWFQLPLVATKTNQIDAKAIIDAIGAKQKFEDIKGTLLYVEDNRSNLELMELIVSHIDELYMYSARNAELGIELAKHKQPDIIILDINLPGMDGFEALKELQKCEQTKNIPVLALSAVAMKNDIENGLNAGFRQYLTKPINVIEVTQAIGKTLQLN